MIPESSVPTIESTPDGYRLVWLAERVTASIERLSEHSDGLVAQVEITTTRDPRPGLLKWGRLDLMAEQTRSRWAAALEKREPDLDWPGMLEQLCRMVHDAHRAGTPAVDLRTVTAPATTRWLVEPFVEQGGVTVLFAMGGTGKSMLALGIACTQASGVAVVGTPRSESSAVLYLDWETDPATATARMRALCWGAQVPSLPPIHYRRQVASLESAAQEIRRDIVKLSASMVVVDSLGAARGGEPESADLTIRTFVALRSLGVPALVVDHVAKAQGNDATTSFGSVYTHNLARLTWGLDKAQEEGADRMTLALVNRKRNNGRLLPRMAYEMAVESDEDGELVAVRFSSRNPDEAMPSKTRPTAAILALLKSGGKTRKEIADELGLPINVVKSRVWDQVQRGVLTTRDEVDGDETVWVSKRDN